MPTNRRPGLARPLLNRCAVARDAELSGPDEIDMLCNEILSFLAESPGSRDTLEGIAEWWLLERDIRRETAKVRLALERLVAEGWLAGRPGADGRVHFSVNGERLPELRLRFGGRGA